MKWWPPMKNDLTLQLYKAATLTYPPVSARLALSYKLQELHFSLFSELLDVQVKNRTDWWSEERITQNDCLQLKTVISL